MKPIRRQREIFNGQSSKFRHELRHIASQKGLPAGEPNLGNSLANRNPRHTLYFLVTQKMSARFPVTLNWLGINLPLSPIKISRLL
jgi:hypothetical protein